MSGWMRHTGTAVLLAAESIDTDQLIPARFMSAPRSVGYGRFLLHDARVDPDGNALSHPLNEASPTILIANRNFGSGSSREAAVYALVDYGICAVLAPSFGDIFAGNAVNNGLLPGVITTAVYDALASYLAEPATLEIDVEALTVSFGDETAAITLDTVPQRKIMNGWDDIDLTAQYNEKIDAYRANRRCKAPWVWPVSR